MTHATNPRRAFGVRLLHIACLATAATTAVGLAPDVHAEEGARGRTTQHGQPNAVGHWNNVAAQAYEPTQGLVPLAQTRTFSIMHASIHDALNAMVLRCHVDATLAQTNRSRAILALLPARARFDHDGLFHTTE